MPEQKLTKVSNMSAKRRQAPKLNTVHLAQVGISARGSSTPKYIVTTTHKTIHLYMYTNDRSLEMNKLYENSKF